MNTKGNFVGLCFYLGASFLINSDASAEEYNNNHFSVTTETKPDYILIRYKNLIGHPHTHVNMRSSAGQVEGPLKGSVKLKATSRVTKFALQGCQKVWPVGSACGRWFTYKHTL